MALCVCVCAHIVCMCCVGAAAGGSGAARTPIIIPRDQLYRLVNLNCWVGGWQVQTREEGGGQLSIRVRDPARSGAMGAGCGLDHHWCA